MGIIDKIWRNKGSNKEIEGFSIDWTRWSNMKSIRTQMLVYLMAGTMILFSIMFFMFELKLNDLPEHIKNQYMEISEARAAEVGNELQGFVQQVAIVSQSPIIRSMDLEKIKSYLPYLPLDDRHRNMTIAYPDGKSWSTLSGNINISGQEQFQKIFMEKKEYIICQPFVSSFKYETDTPIIIVAHSVKDDSGKIVGLVNIVIETYFLDEILRGMDLKNTGYGWIVNKDGLIISHPDSNISLVENIEGHIGDRTVIGEVVANQSGTFKYTDKDGENILAFFKDIEGSPDWTFIVSIPEKEIYKEINSIQNTILISGVITLILLLTFVFIFSNSLSKPILGLKEVFEKAADGNLDVRADEKAPHELGNAGKSFNKMLEQIKDLTYIDRVTGLYNYNSFLIMLPEKMKALAEKNLLMKIVMVSIDDFKRVNRIVGYEMGDRVLEILGTRLKTYLSEEEIVARFLGDEFILLIHGDSLKAIEKRIQELWNLYRGDIIVKENKFILTSSLGASDIVDENTSIDEAIHQATVAMHIAKKEGGNICISYNAQLDELIKQEQRLEKDLIHAIENRKLKLAYQPIIKASSGKIMGVETLLRWNHPELGYISPPTIIRIAEQSGLIVEMGRCVLEEAIVQNKKWQDKGYLPIITSVNVLVIQFEQSDFVDMVKEILDEVGLDPKYLEIEITETNIMSGVNKKLKKMEELRNMGVRISIDDFGTGYSSLAYLAQFPINTLKIDRSFIVDMLEKKSAKSIVTTIINMSKAIHVKTTAEGVETIEQLELLQEYGCDKIQGYLFSKPIYSQDMEEVLKKEYLNPKL